MFTPEKRAVLASLKFPQFTNCWNPDYSVSASSSPTLPFGRVSASLEIRCSFLLALCLAHMGVTLAMFVGRDSTNMGNAVVLPRVNCL